MTDNLEHRIASNTRACNLKMTLLQTWLVHWIHSREWCKYCLHRTSWN